MRAPVRVGQIVGPHGLKGHVKIQPLTDFHDRFQKGARLRLKGNWVTVESFTVHKNRPLVKLSGIETIDDAQAVQWEYVESIQEAPELGQDEYLSQDLVGCRVYTTSGRELGPVKNVLQLPAHDVLEIEGTLIPAVKQFIRKIDLKRKVITVELIPGMLPGEEDEGVTA